MIMKKWDTDLEQSKARQINSDFFDKIDAEGKAYWLGFIFADGSVRKSYDVFTVKLQIRDKGHLKKLALIFDKPLKIEQSRCKGEMFSQTVLRVFSKYLCHSLADKGIVPLKTFVDSDVFCHIPKHLIRHFIRGNMDGDGCICRFMNCGKVRYHVDFLGRVKFINELRSIFEKQFLGKQFYAVPYQSICRMTVSFAPTIECLLTWLYSDATVYLERKHNSYLKLKREMDAGILKTSDRRNIRKAWRTRKAA